MSTGPHADHGEHPRYYIVALARGLDVLSQFTEARPELTLADIAEAAGVTLSSAVRIAYTLTQTRFLIRNPITKAYRLGPKGVAVGFATLGAMTLPELAAPYLVGLRDTSGATIKLGIPDDNSVVIIGRFPSLRHPTVGSHLGSRMPLFIGSLGRAILAWQEPALQTQQIDASLYPWKPTPRTLDGTKLKAELEATRRRGYAFNDQGVTIGHRSVGAPIRDRKDQVIAAVNISLSTHLANIREMHTRYAPMVLTAAAEIGSILPAQVRGGRLDSNEGTD